MKLIDRNILQMENEKDRIGKVLNSIQKDKNREHLSQHLRD